MLTPCPHHAELRFGSTGLQLPQPLSSLSPCNTHALQSFWRTNLPEAPHPAPPLHFCPIARSPGCWLIPVSWAWPGDLCDLSRSRGVNWKPSFRQAKQSGPFMWETGPSRPSSQPLRAVSPLLGAQHLLQLCPVAGVQALLLLSRELC